MTAERVTLPNFTPNRHYLFHGPDSSNEPVPLLVFLHGTGGTAAWADDETGWSAFAARERFALALPDALAPDPTKPPKFFTNPPRWNDGSPAVGEFVPSPADDVAFLTAVISDAMQRGPIDRHRIYFVGFSNGAGMTFRFAAERSELLAAIAPVSGHCWIPHPKPIRPVPTFFLIGTVDPLIPLDGGPVRLPWGGRFLRPAIRDTLHAWAEAIGCEPLPMSQPVGEVHFPAKPGGVEFRANFVPGLGHHWPGGKGQFDTRYAGPYSDTVNGNERVWAFLRRHRIG